MLIPIFIVSIIVSLSPQSLFNKSQNIIQLIQLGQISQSLNLIQNPEIDINQITESSEQTVLMEAIIKRQIDIVEALLKREDLDINQKDEKGNTALYIAVVHGQVEIIELILKEKGDIVDVNIENEEGETVFMLALENNQKRICKLFAPFINDDFFKKYLTDVIAKANMTLYDNFKRIFFEQCDKNKEFIIKKIERTLSSLEIGRGVDTLEEGRQKVKNLEMIFNEVNSNEHEVDFIKWCLKKSFHQSVSLLISEEKIRETYTHYLFEMAQRQEDSNTFQSLLVWLLPGYLQKRQVIKLGAQSVQKELKVEKDELQERIEALENEDFLCYEQLLKDSKKIDDWHCLMEIMNQDESDKNERIICYLLPRLQRKDLKRVTAEGMNIMSCTLLSGNLKAFQYLKKHWEYLFPSLFIKDSYGRGPLMQIIASGNYGLLKNFGKERIVKGLREERDLYGETPLMMLVAFNRKEMLQYILLNYGREISVTQRNGFNEDALILALSKGKWQVYETLLEKAPSMSHQYYLMKMVKKDNVQAVQYLLDRVSPQDLLQESEKGETVLSQAILTGSFQVIRLIMAKRKTIEEEFDLLFHAYIKRNRDKILRILIKEGYVIHPEVGGSSSYDHLVNAVCQGQREEVRLVVETSRLKKPQFIRVYKEALLMSFLKENDEITEILIKAQPEIMERCLIDCLVAPFRWRDAKTGENQKKALSTRVSKISWSDYGLLKMLWEDAFDRNDLLLVEYLLKIKKISFNLREKRGLVEAVHQNNKELLTLLMKSKRRDGISTETADEWKKALILSFKENRFDLSEVLIVHPYEKEDLLYKMHDEVCSFQESWTQDKEMEKLQCEKNVNTYQDILKSQRGLMGLPFYGNLSKKDIQSFLRFSQGKEGVYQQEFEEYENYLSSHIKIKDQDLKKETLNDEQKLLLYLENETSTSLLFKEEGPFEIDLMMYSAYKGWIDIVKYLYQTQQMSLERCNSKGRSALFYLCMNDNLLKITHFFNIQSSRYIQYFHKLNFSKSMTVSMYAASQGFFDLTALLLKGNCEEIARISAEGFSVLEYSLLEKKAEKDYLLFINEFEEAMRQIRDKKDRIKDEIGEKNVEAISVRQGARNRGREVELTQENRREEQRRVDLELDQITSRLKILEEELKVSMRDIEQIQKRVSDLGMISASLGHQSSMKYYVEKYSNVQMNSSELENRLFKIMLILHFYPSKQMKQYVFERLEKAPSIGTVVEWFRQPSYKEYSKFLGGNFHPSFYEMCLFKHKVEMIEDRISKSCEGLRPFGPKEANDLIDIVLINPLLDQEKYIKMILNKIPKTRAVFDPSVEVAKETILKMIASEYPLSKEFLNDLMLYVPGKEDRKKLAFQVVLIAKKEFIEDLGGNFYFCNNKWINTDEEDELENLLQRVSKEEKVSSSTYSINDWEKVVSQIVPKAKKELIESLRKVIVNRSADSDLADELQLLLKRVSEENIFTQDLNAYSFNSWLKAVSQIPKWFFPNKEGEPIWNQFFKTSQKDGKVFSYGLVLARDCINQQNRQGQTGLMVAIEEWTKCQNTIKKEEIIQMIQHLIAVSKNIDWTLKDNKNKDLLQYAIEAGALTIFKILINAGAPFYYEGDFNKSHLHYALIHSEEIADYLLKTFPFIMENTGKGCLTPLRDCVLRGESKKVSFLMKYKGGLNRTFDSKTLLDEALLTRNFEVALLLFESGMSLEQLSHLNSLRALKQSLLLEEKSSFKSTLMSTRGKMQKMVMYLQRSA